MYKNSDIWKNCIAYVKTYHHILCGITIHDAVDGLYFAQHSFIWNDSKTLAVGLFELINGTDTTNFTVFAAGAVLVAVPITIVFILFQKYLVQGVASGADKG